MMVSILTRIAWMLAAAGVAYLIYRGGGFNTVNLAKVGEILATHGGRILILFSLTVLFFGVAMGLGYHMLAMIEQKTLTSDNTIATMLLQFVFSTAFGTCLGALIQLLGGSSPDKPV
jgi:hypothetical protein